MRIHHLNCTTIRPLGGALLLGREGARTLGHAMVCHCLVVETPAHGLVLIDSGFGLADVRDPRGRLGAPYLRVVRPELDEAATALRQIEALGFARADVRHVILTHMDVDHAGGLSDFPAAAVHVYRRELDAALAPRSLQDRARYRACQWAHGARFRAYDEPGEPWFGFSAVRALDGLPPELLIVPLTGHSHGHAAVAVDTGAGWLLHCGDGYFHRDEMRAGRPSCPPGLRLFQALVQADGGARADNQRRLRRLVRDHGDEVRVFSAHDAVEWEQLAGSA